MANRELLEIEPLELKFHRNRSFFLSFSVVIFLRFSYYLDLCFFWPTFLFLSRFSFFSEDFFIILYDLQWNWRSRFRVRCSCRTRLKVMWHSRYGFSFRNMWALKITKNSFLWISPLQQKSWLFPICFSWSFFLGKLHVRNLGQDHES